MDDLLDDEEETLVAAQDEPSLRIRRPDRAQFEPADAVLATEEQLLENRQVSSRETTDVLGLHPEPNRHTVVLLEEHHPFVGGIYELRIAA